MKKHRFLGENTQHKKDAFSKKESGKVSKSKQYDKQENAMERLAGWKGQGRARPFVYGWFTSGSQMVRE